MNLMNAYTENRQLCREMTRIVEEELEHFEDGTVPAGQTRYRISPARPGAVWTQLERLDSSSANPIARSIGCWSRR